MNKLLSALDLFTFTKIKNKFNTLTRGNLLLLTVVFLYYTIVFQSVAYSGKLCYTTK